MLIGLSAKNAILIVEFAKRITKAAKHLRRRDGRCRPRLPPIVMTAFAFIFGCLPLWVATGSGLSTVSHVP